MTKKEQLRRRIIELIHGVPYDTFFKNATLEQVASPIKLGILLKSLGNANINTKIKTDYYECNITMIRGISEHPMSWLLTLPSGEEATIYNQSEETLEALHQLLITE